MYHMGRTLDVNCSCTVTPVTKFTPPFSSSSFWGGLAVPLDAFGAQAVLGTPYQNERRPILNDFRNKGPELILKSMTNPCKSQWKYRDFCFGGLPTIVGRLWG